MTKNQENRLSMYLTVQQVTNYFSNAWQAFLPFKIQYSEFETLLEKIKAIRPIQEAKITGVTKDKTEARKKVSQKALKIGEKVFAYASIIGNNKLKDRVNYRPSDFIRCRDTVLCDYIQVIYNAANQHLSELADFDVTQKELDELKRLNDNYSVIIENPRQAVTNRTRATKYIQMYFSQTDIIIKERLDKLMNHFKEENPDFWHQYKSARKIVNLGHRKRKPEEALEVQAAN